MYEWPIVFTLDDRKATGRDVARRFADTFQWPRTVQWLRAAGSFRFVDGTHVYFAEMTPTGWIVKIKEASS
jgi:hypothetical protein